MTEKIALLQRYMPSAAAPIIAEWIVDSRCQFKIVKSRRSKFGDYRSPHGKLGHRISINADLNPYAFLLTAVHEFAHLKTWTMHKHRVRPHGSAWKSNFKDLMQVFPGDIFPDDIRSAVSQYLHNPSASSCTDLHLFRVLKKYDPANEVVHFVETLPDKSVFSLSNGRVFEKGAKLRKRYRCIEVKTGRVYLFNPLAEVQPITNL